MKRGDLVTIALRDAPLFRIRVEATSDNGFGRTIGHLDDESMLAINRALAVFLGFV